MFTTSVGTPIDGISVTRRFQEILQAADLTRTCSENTRQTESPRPQSHRRLGRVGRGIIIVATLVGMALNFLGINPITAL